MAVEIAADSLHSIRNVLFFFLCVFVFMGIDVDVGTTAFAFGEVDVCFEYYFLIVLGFEVN